MYIEGRYPSKEEDFVPYSQEELNALKRKHQKQSSQKRKIETIEDENWAIQEITKLIQNSERSASMISKILNIDAPSKTVKSIIESIPGITIRKEKRTLYYTLEANNKELTLF